MYDMITTFSGLGQYFVDCFSTVHEAFFNYIDTFKDSLQNVWGYIDSCDLPAWAVTILSCAVGTGLLRNILHWG